MAIFSNCEFHSPGFFPLAWLRTVISSPSAHPAPTAAHEASCDAAINPEFTETTMQTRHLVSAAAIALIFSASGAFAADDGCRTVANGVQKCDVPTGSERSRDAVVAEIHSARADTSTGCRTVANGVQKCDVPTGGERSRDAVVADLHGAPAYTIAGCRTIANGVQKCDVPTAYDRNSDTAVAKLH